MSFSSNEAILSASAIIDILFVFIVARRQSDRLFEVIALNLILVSIFGTKLVNVFGFETNVENIFYACIFLATHFMIERQDKKHAYRSIWLGIATVIVFTLLCQPAIHLVSSASTSDISRAMNSVFSFSPRIVLASLLAFAFSQFINIYIYNWIKIRTHDRLLWLQSNGANTLAQFAGSCIFFAIAFIDMSGAVLIQAIITGWLIKTLVVALGSPFLYLDRYLNKKLT